MSIHRFHPIAFVSLAGLLLASCTLPINIMTSNPSPVPVDANAIYTAAAQTLVAQLTQNAPAPNQPTYTAPPTYTIAPDTETPLPTETPAPGTPTPTITVGPVFSPTSQGQIVTASMPTNCREGPDPAYAIVGYLKSGQSATILGRNPSRTWWYIQNPSNQGFGCWVWGVTAIATGDTVSLPVFTPPAPPPTTTPGGGSYTLSLGTTHKCGGEKTAILTVHNVSTAIFESANIKSTDFTAGDVLATYADNTPFMDSKSDCSGSIDILDEGETLYIPIGLDGAPAGHEIKVTVTLCTKEDLGGKCVSNTIKFDMP